MDRIEDDFLAHLRQVNSERLAAWEQPGPIMLCCHCGSSNRNTTQCAPPYDRLTHSFTNPHPFLLEEPQKTDGIFHATELGREVGEVLNVVKKLHREEMGWRGSRATKDQLSDEIGDVLICLDKLAAHYGIDLAEATVRKFNATSEKVGLPQRIAAHRRAAAPEKESAHPSLELCVQFSDCGQHIRKWSRLPFDGGTDFYSHPVTTQPDPRDAEFERLREALTDAKEWLAQDDTSRMNPQEQVLHEFLRTKIRTALANSEDN